MQRVSRVSSRLGLVGVVMLVNGPASAQGLISVVRELPTVTRVQYARDRLPADMPITNADGGGVCNNLFELEAFIGSSVEEPVPGLVRVYPERFELITRLKVTIYTPERAPAKLVAHEEGHRAIGEYYYASAEDAAREAAAGLAGQVFEASGLDRAAAEHEAGVAVLAALKEAFMQRTHARSSAANARYDEITGHGLRAVAENVAIAQAIAADP